MIKLFASDLDGTLLNEKHESDEVIEQTIQNIIDHLYERICDLGTKPGAFAFFHNIKRSPS